MNDLDSRTVLQFIVIDTSIPIRIPTISVRVFIGIGSIARVKAIGCLPPIWHPIRICVFQPRTRVVVRTEIIGHFVFFNIGESIFIPISV
jgi:hypothetical protein